MNMQKNPWVRRLADGSAPDSAKWSYDVGGSGWGNNELEYYTTNNARIEDGKLVIEARQEDFSGKKYTSARLLTKGKWSWTYGRIEARIQIPRGQGIWPAFWMLGANRGARAAGQVSRPARKIALNLEHCHAARVRLTGHEPCGPGRRDASPTLRFRGRPLTRPGAQKDAETAGIQRLHQLPPNAGARSPFQALLFQQQLP
jgi:hypothetical protein